MVCWECSAVYAEAIRQGAPDAALPADEIDGVGDLEVEVEVESCAGSCGPRFAPRERTLLQQIRGQ